MWGSKKKNEYWNGPNGKAKEGKDNEDYAFLRARINPLNKVKKHTAINANYDYTVKPRFGKHKMEKIREVKTKNTRLTLREKALQKKHPRKFEVERINSATNPLHQVRKLGRKIKRI